MEIKESLAFRVMRKKRKRMSVWERKKPEMKKRKKLYIFERFSDSVKLE